MKKIIELAAAVALFLGVEFSLVVGVLELYIVPRPEGVNAYCSMPRLEGSDPLSSCACDKRTERLDLSVANQASASVSVPQARAVDQDFIGRGEAAQSSKYKDLGPKPCQRAESRLARPLGS